MRTVIYTFSFPESGCAYVGKTGNFRRRRTAHRNDMRKLSYALHSALKKYGWREPVPIEEVDGDGCDAEKFWVSYLGTLAPNGYNLTEGGERGFSMCSATRRKLGDYAKARWQDPGMRARIMNRAPLTEEARQEAAEKTRNLFKNPLFRAKQASALSAYANSLHGKRQSVVAQGSRCKPVIGRKGTVRIEAPSIGAMARFLGVTDHAVSVALKGICRCRGYQLIHKDSHMNFNLNERAAPLYHERPN